MLVSLSHYFPTYLRLSSSSGSRHQMLDSQKGQKITSRLQKAFYSHGDDTHAKLTLLFKRGEKVNKRRQYGAGRRPEPRQKTRVSPPSTSEGCCSFYPQRMYGDDAAWKMMRNRSRRRRNSDAAAAARVDVTFFLQKKIKGLTNALE